MSQTPDNHTPVADQRSGQNLAQRIGLIVGLLLAIGLQFIPAPEGLSQEAWLLASLGLMMAAWWATEAIPIAATGLVPIALFPLFGITTTGAATAPYASPIIMLLLGGFIIALAVEKWNLHTRIALNVLSGFGGKPAALIGGFMVATALLSMWISNTATTLMMIPIALKVAQEVQQEGAASKFFAPALVLGVAYAASIGGMATPVGSPTNLIGIGYLESEFGRTVEFVEWMGLGIPAAMLIIPAGWFILTKIVFKLEAKSESTAAKTMIADQLKALGKMTTAEVRIASLFGTVAILWMGRSLPVIGGWNDLLAWFGTMMDLPFTLALGNTQIAVMGALAAFLIPAGGKANKGQALMDWEGVKRLPWDVIILFGGGLSLAAALRSTGLAVYLGGHLTFLTTLPLPILILILVAIVVFLTELTSNVATTTAFLPVMGALAAGAGVPPEQLVIPVAVAASCAFMLPVATAPNAIVYASGATSQGQMIRAGFRINLAAIGIITALGAWLGPIVFAG